MKHLQYVGNEKQVVEELLGNHRAKVAPIGALSISV